MVASPTKSGAQLGAPWIVSLSGAAIINHLFLHSGWMASMLSLAAWRREWTWSRKWSLSVRGLGEPPRRSLSRTVESSSRLAVDTVLVSSPAVISMRESEWKRLFLQSWHRALPLYADNWWSQSRTPFFYWYLKSVLVLHQVAINAHHCV